MLTTGQVQSNNGQPFPQIKEETEQKEEEEERRKEQNHEEKVKRFQDGNKEEESKMRDDDEPQSNAVYRFKSGEIPTLPRNSISILDVTTTEEEPPTTGIFRETFLTSKSYIFRDSSCISIL